MAGGVGVRRRCGIERDRRIGAACAVGSAAAFGVTIVVQRELATRGLSVTTALGLRFAIAAALLAALLTAARQPVVPVPGERVRAGLLGGVGYAIEAGLFYVALRHGSAGAVALLFYAYPAIVTLLEVLRRKLPARPRTFGVVVLSTLGAVLVVASGDAVDISGTGVLFALLAATSFSVYLIASHALIRRSAPGSVGVWVAGGAAAALLAAGLLGPGVSVARADLPLVALNGAATATAFGLLYTALRRLDAASTAVVMTLEAFVAVGLAAALLDEAVAWLQLVGGVAIVAAAVLVAFEKQAPTADPEAVGATPPP